MPVLLGVSWLTLTLSYRTACKIIIQILKPEPWFDQIYSWKWLWLYKNCYKTLGKNDKTMTAVKAACFLTLPSGQLWHTNVMIIFQFSIDVSNAPLFYCWNKIQVFTCISVFMRLSRTCQQTGNESQTWQFNMHKVRGRNILLFLCHTN